MAVKIELSFQGSCKNPRSVQSAANGLLSGFCVSRESLRSGESLYPTGDEAY